MFRKTRQIRQLTAHDGHRPHTTRVRGRGRVVVGWWLFFFVLWIVFETTDIIRILLLLSTNSIILFKETTIFLH
jgi:hypothetical protein